MSLYPSSLLLLLVPLPPPLLLLLTCVADQQVQRQLARVEGGDKRPDAVQRGEVQLRELDLQGRGRGRAALSPGPPGGRASLHWFRSPVAAGTSDA